MTRIKGKKILITTFIFLGFLAFNFALAIVDTGTGLPGTQSGDKGCCFVAEGSCTYIDKNQCDTIGTKFYSEQPCAEITKCATPSKEEADPNNLIYPQIPTIGEIIKLNADVKVTGDAGGRYYAIPWIAETIGAIYQFGVGAAAVLAVVMVVIGGFIWLTAGGNQNQVTTAKGYITGALIGLVLALGTYTVMYLVNPELVNLRSILIPYVEPQDMTMISTDEISGQSIYTPPEGGKEMATFTISGYSGQIKVNEGIAEEVKAALTEIVDSGYSLTQVGSYRNPESDGFSWHWQGLAIDINHDQNPCPCCYSGKDYKTCKDTGSEWEPGVDGALTKEVVNAFKSRGWCWGGDWCHFKDYMHFSRPTNAGSKECGAPCPYQW